MANVAGNVSVFPLSIDVQLVSTKANRFGFAPTVRFHHFHNPIQSALEYRHEIGINDLFCIGKLATLIEFFNETAHGRAERDNRLFAFPEPLDGPICNGFRFDAEKHLVNDVEHFREVRCGVHPGRFRTWCGFYVPLFLFRPFVHIRNHGVDVLQLEGNNSPDNPGNLIGYSPMLHGLIGHREGSRCFIEHNVIHLNTIESALTAYHLTL